MMCKQWHLMEHCIPAQLICHPQLDILTWYFKTPSMGNGCGKHRTMNSIYWQIMQYMRAWALLFPLQTDLIFQLHHIVATLVQDILIESPQKQRFCSSYNKFCGIFCEVKLTDIWNTRSPRLHWPHSITRSSLESVLVFTLHISLLVSQNAGNTHRSYPGLRAVYLMPMINIGPWEMCILSTLIFEILQSSTESCPSLCMIIHYGGGPWPPTQINQSPVCHCAKTWWISYPLWVSLR